MQNRRRFVGRALLVLSWAYATAVGAYVLASALTHPAWWNEMASSVRVLGSLGGIAILTLGVSYLLLFVRDLLKGEGSQYLLSKTSQGTARISLRAIQTSLMRRVRELDEVIGAKLAVRRPAEKRLKVEVAYTTTEDRNAILVSEALRKALRERFNELVHPEEGFEAEFDVKIDGFVPGGSGARKKEEETEPEQPFTGPRYPID
jgi:hypothetical protein